MSHVLCAHLAGASAIARADDAANTKYETVRVYYGDPDVALPDLITSQPPLPTKDKCHDKLEGRVRLSLIVDTQGVPRNVYLLQAVGTDLDRLALAIASSERYKPASLRGQAVAVGRSVNMHLRACVTRGNTSSGKMGKIELRGPLDQTFEDRLSVPQDVELNAKGEGTFTPGPVYRVGNGVEQPKPIFMREAQFSDYARSKKIEGVCVISLIVDAQGLPQNIHISKKLEDSLDEKAMEAVSSYRFMPSLRNGRPVPVRISVEVRFRLY